MTDAELRPGAGGVRHSQFSIPNPKFLGGALVAALVAATLWLSPSGHAQSGAADGEWRAWAGDLGATRYAPLDQITAANFSQLEVAWRFQTENLGPRPDFNLQATPLMVNGVLYATAGADRNAVAIDAATGQLLWMHRLDEGERGRASVRRLSGRGVGYWTDGKGDERVFYVTIGYQLVGLEARTGRPLRDFGVDGIVDLKKDADQELDPVTGEIAWNGAPVVARNVILVGAAHRAGTAPRSMTNAKGYVRAYDTRTGKRLWIFHTIPRPGEFGNDTWLNDSWSYTGNTGVWTQMTVDEALGIAYLPVEIPTGDYFGGHRPGNNLFGESLVAVELETGRRLWHFQFVHHPIWDYDVPCAPILADIVVDGRPIKAIAQPTKQGWVYVFDRVTGQPVWPIEERPVPRGTVPTEWYAPTQPYPTKPPPFERQGFLEDYVIDFTPEIKAEALKLASRYQLGPIFTPPIVRGEGGKEGLLFIPNGANWPGGSLDPETGTLYVYSHTLLRVLSLVNDSRRSDMAYISTGGGDDGGGGGGLSVQGLPLVKPPWGRITAIDLNRGEIRWQVAHGETPDAVKNHPLLKGVNVPRTGRPGGAGGSSGGIGTLVTKTLLISGEGGTFTTPSGQRGAMLRAYDKATGAEVGEVYMPGAQTGSPMTYLLNGRQYIVVAVSSNTLPGELIAYRLPGR
jgi:quinoprotein glucose dehydrogenase